MSYFEEFLAKGASTGNFYPQSGYPSADLIVGEEAGLSLDGGGNLVTRGATLTDEGSLREGFVGSSLSTTITGTLTFTNGSNLVTGSGTSFLSMGISTFHSDFIKLNADGESFWIKVSSVEDDTNLTLESAYLGTGGTGAASFTKFKPTTGTGGSITVGSGNCVISSGTTNSSKTSISKDIDYCPIIFMTYATVSQRIANQTGYIGMVDNIDNPTNSAWFEFSGTVNTQVVCKSVLDSAVESTTIALPSGLTTASKLRYRVEISLEYVQFSIEGVTVATHYNLIPNPYAVMGIYVGWVNGTGAATSSSITLDTVFISNTNVLQIQGGFLGMPLRVENPPTQKLAQTSASSLNAYLVPQFDVLAYKTITVQVSGTWVGRVQFQASVDGVFFYPVACVCIDDNVFFETFISNGIYLIPNSGFSYLRAQIIGYTSGTLLADVTLNSSPLPVPSSSPKVGITDLQSNRGVMVTGARELRVVESMRLIGKGFEGSTLDTVYWTPTVANGGTNTLQNGYMSMDTTTNSASRAFVQTVRIARFIAGSQNMFRSTSRFATVGITNNVRRIGVFDANNGFFFQLAGTTFSVVTRLNGVDMVTSSGFNGNLGDFYNMNTNTHSFEILYLNSGIEFYIDGKLLHERKYTDRPLCATMNLPASLENINIGAVSGISTIETRSASIFRLGKYETAPKSEYINTATTTTLKSGPGLLQKIITGGASKSTITVYDSLTASGHVLLSLDCSYIYSPSIPVGLEFYTGLTVVTSNNVYGSVPVCTVVFE